MAWNQLCIPQAAVGMAIMAGSSCGKLKGKKVDETVSWFSKYAKCAQRTSLGVAAICYAANVAFAANICDAVALYSVPAEENPSSILKRGEFLGGINALQFSKRTGEIKFCSHGGYCYPTSVVIDGKKVEALILTNCSVGEAELHEKNDPETYYRLNVVRSRVAPRELLKDDTNNALLQKGLDSASAGNAASAYAYKPESLCSRVVAQVLKGSKKALDKIVNDDIGCENVASAIANQKPK